MRVDRSVALELLGQRVDVACDDAVTADVVGRLWAPFVVAGERGQSAGPATVRYRLADDGLQRDGVTLPGVGGGASAGARAPADGAGGAGRGSSAPEAWVALGAFAQDLNRTVLTRAGLPLAVHAGCVTDGVRTVAWPAASTVGKSTFTAACAAAGWRYVTDEGVVLAGAGASEHEGGGGPTRAEDVGVVVPYPRPLGLVGAARERFGTPGSVAVPDELLVPPVDLRAVGVGERPRLTDLLLLDRRPGVQGLDLSPVPRVEAVPVLLQRSFNGYRDQPSAVAALTALAGEVRVWRALYTDAWDAAPLLADALA